MDLTLRLIQVKQALANELNELLAEFSLNVRAYWVMSKAAPGVLTQRELAQRCEIDKTTMVATIDELEAKGVLSRTRSATDRRAWIISLTESGKELLANVQPIFDRVEARALEGIPADEREVFVSVLARLSESRRSRLSKSS